MWTPANSQVISKSLCLVSYPIMHYADLCRYLAPVQKSISSSSSFTLCNISLHYNFLSHQEQKSSRPSRLMMLSSNRQLPRFPDSPIIRPTN